jgi:hypothetical protein
VGIMVFMTGSGEEVARPLAVDQNPADQTGGGSRPQA